MSLVSTLAKVAIGIAVAKGIKSVAGGSASQSGGGMGDLLGNVLGGKQTNTQSGGGLGDLLGQLGGGASQTSGGGIGDLLGQLGGGRNQGGATGLEGIMDGLLKGNAGAKGGIGDLLGQLGGGTAAGGLGGLLSDALSNGGQVSTAPSQDDEQAAALMIRAMLQAAKADGQIDEDEKQKLLGNLGDLDATERDLINQELNRGIDVDALARDVPRGMEDQVYMMSVMAIDLDTKGEAQYLHDLAGALGIDKAKSNNIHSMMGAPALYS